MDCLATEGINIVYIPPTMVFVPFVLFKVMNKLKTCRFVFGSASQIYRDNGTFSFRYIDRPIFIYSIPTALLGL